MKRNTWIRCLAGWRLAFGAAGLVLAIWALSPAALTGQEPDAAFVEDLGEEDEFEEDEFEEDEFEEDEFEEDEFERPTLEELREFVDEFFPEAGEELSWAEREGSEEDLENVLEHLVDFYAEYHERMEEEPESARLFLGVARARLVAHRLVDRYSESEGLRERARWRSELETAVAVWFDREVALEEFDLALLKEEVRLIELLLEDRKQRRVSEIADLMSDVLGEDEYEGADDFDAGFEDPADGSDTLIHPEQF